MMVRSYSLRSSPRTISSRLPTESVTRTPGHSRWNAATIDGARYFAVLTTPNTSEPDAPAFSASMRSPARDGEALDVLRHRQQFRADFRGRERRVAGAPEQGRADQLLQQFELDADGGRRDVELRRGAGDRAALDRGGQRAQLLSGESSQIGPFRYSKSRLPFF